ncbi:hypothetical protein CANINC_004414 [Pichia inconspicua]|uniref:Uncharacterized protein n=1 Tax=Pichia inconspicua TaxID=52247 RepID=A0A4T0WXE4_9ASCO|nr:hypothetical protein CANINC_004414 [[Candida] inconspicua]
MKLNVKIDQDLTLSLTVPDNATVEDLKVATIVALPSENSLLNSLDITSLSPKNINLWYSGHKLDYSKSLYSYNITPQSLITNPNLLIHLTSINDDLPPKDDSSDFAISDDINDTIISINSKSGKTKSKSRSKSKSKKCSFLNCTSTPLRMVGDCQHCQGKFCSKHRLLESHNCKGLKIYKDKCYERNALKLQSEQTVASKV